jgi:peptidoglycan-associated lipoprotein
LKEQLAKNPKLQIVIEGNCDERGGVEYNIALGQKRAESAKKILVQHGIPDSSIKTVSFGKERKLVQGTTAVAYLQNRAAIVKIQK